MKKFKVGVDVLGIKSLYTSKTQREWFSSVNMAGETTHSIPYNRAIVLDTLAKENNYQFSHITNQPARGNFLTFLLEYAILTPGYVSFDKKLQTITFDTSNIIERVKTVINKNLTSYGVLCSSTIMMADEWVFDSDMSKKAGKNISCNMVLSKGVKSTKNSKGIGDPVLQATALIQSLYALSLNLSNMEVERELKEEPAFIEIPNNQVVNTSLIGAYSIILSDIYYYLEKANSVSNRKPILVVDYDEKNIDMVDKKKLKDTSLPPVTLDTLKDKHALNNDAVNCEVDYSKVIIPEILEDLLPVIAKTSLKNIQLSGSAGAGKSYSVGMFAYALNLPHYSEVASSDKLADYEWFATLQPRTDNAVDADKIVETKESLDLFKNEGLFVDETVIECSPEAAYFELFGEDVDKKIDCKSPQMRNYLLRNLQKVRNEIAGRVKNKNDDFVMVLTELGKAATYGGCIDLQEIDMARDISQVSGLYEFLQEGYFRLPDGRKLKRHKDCIVFITNNNAVGCSPLPEAFLSRFRLKEHYSSIDKAIVCARLIAKGLDENISDFMAEVYESLSKLFDEEAVSDGSIGFREIDAWAEFYMLTKDLGLSARYCVLNKFSESKDVKQQAIEVFEAAQAILQVKGVKIDGTFMKGLKRE